MTAGRVEVQAGEVTDGSIGISGELTVGDMLAASGIAQIREGMVLKRWQP